LELLGLPLQRFWEFPFDPGAITIVEIENGQAILRAHNLMSHLDGIAGAPHKAPVARGGAL
jgi:broad specificity phosphatase PhoE